VVNIFTEFIYPIVFGFIITIGVTSLYFITQRRIRDKYFQSLSKIPKKYDISYQTKILRERIFVHHLPDAQKMITSEITINSKANNVKNIFFQFSNFLPNLTVFDESGDVLPIMPNDITRAAIMGWIEVSQGPEKERLCNLLDDIELQNVFVIWIKLPEKKTLFADSNMILKLEYDVEKKHSELDITLAIKPEPHNVFYTLTKPENYDFRKTDIIWFDEKGEKQSVNWKDKFQKKLYCTKTHDGFTLTSKAEQKNTLILNYSFFPERTIILFPVLAVVFLFIFGSAFVSLQFCNLDELCSLGEINPKIFERSLEVGTFVITASLILPRLIHNHLIRNWIYLLISLPIIPGMLILLNSFR